LFIHLQQAFYEKRNLEFICGNTGWFGRKRGRRKG